MKKLLFAGMAALCGLMAQAAVPSSTGATTNWVAKYVAAYVANAVSNSAAQVAMDARTETTEGGTTSITVGSGENQLTATYELAVNQCVTASDCTDFATDRGITNGAKWVKSGNQFVGAGLPSITAGEGVWHCATFTSKDSSIAEFYIGNELAFRTTLSYVTESKAKEIKGED